MNKGRRTISLADPRYAVPAEGKGGKSKAPKLDDFDRELKSIRERTAAIEAETAAQAGLNPTVDDYGYAVNRASEAQALYTAAKEAGTAAGKELSDVQQLLAGDFSKLSPAAREQAQTMLSVAEGYAAAEAAAEKLSEKQDKIRERAEEAAAFQKDLARGIVDGFIEGKDAAEVFADALGKIGDRLLDLAFDTLFDPQAGGGGLIPQLLGSFFGGGKGVPAYAKGTNYHPGGPAIVGEKGLEVLNLPRGTSVTPADAIPRMPKLAGEGRAPTSMNDNRVFHIDARGAQRGVGEEIQDALRAYDKTGWQRVGRDFAEARRRNAV